jgi:hypothetical protein
MKQAVIVLLLASVAVNCFGQQNTPGSISRPDRLQKSKNQKKAAGILLCGGATLFAIGAVIPQGDEKITPYGFGGFTTIGHENDGIKGTLYLTGTLSMIGSAPLFFASGKNKRKALRASTSLIVEKAPAIQRASIVKRSYPAFSAAVRL